MTIETVPDVETWPEAPDMLTLDGWRVWFAPPGTGVRTILAACKQAIAGEWGRRWFADLSAISSTLRMVVDMYLSKRNLPEFELARTNYLIVDHDGPGPDKLWVLWNSAPPPGRMVRKRKT